MMKFYLKGKCYQKDELKFDEDIFHELQVALTMGGEFANDTKKVIQSTKWIDRK